MKFEISLFKFDYQSDYLPYYTKHFITVHEELNLLDILKSINTAEPFSFIDDENEYVNIHDIFVSLKTPLSEIKQAFGAEIQINPLSIQRAKNDLIINEDDFHEKYQLLKNFIPKNNFEYQELYNNYKVYYYASNTLNLEKKYVGDALFLLAYDLILKFPEKEQFILELLLTFPIGLSYHTSLEKRVFNINHNIEEKIKLLQDKTKLLKKEQNFRINNTKKLDFSSPEKVHEIKHDFDNFKVAYYKGTKQNIKLETIIAQTKIKSLNLSSLYHDLALKTFHINSKFTFQIASQIMIDAFDNGADFLLVDDEDLFYLFDYNRKELEKVSGREILLPVLHSHEFIKLINGSFISVQETLNKHIQKLEII